MAESLTPVGSAPWLVTEIELAGWVRAAPTLKKSVTLIVYGVAVLPESTWKRTVPPALTVWPSIIRTSSYILWVWLPTMLPVVM